jgi:hypothetical protein
MMMGLCSISLLLLLLVRHREAQVPLRHSNSCILQAAVQAAAQASSTSCGTNGNISLTMTPTQTATSSGSKQRRYSALLGHLSLLDCASILQAAAQASSARSRQHELLPGHTAHTACYVLVCTVLSKLLRQDTKSVARTFSMQDHNVLQACRLQLASNC